MDYKDWDPQTPTGETPVEPQNCNKTSYQATTDNDLKYAYKPSDTTMRYAYDAPETPTAQENPAGTTGFVMVDSTPNPDSPASAPETPHGGEYARANGYTRNENYHYEPTTGGYNSRYSAGGYTTNATDTTPATATGGGYGGNGNGGGYHGTTGYNDYQGGGAYGNGGNGGYDNTIGAYRDPNAGDNYGYTGTAYNGRAQRTKQKQAMNITKRGFILVLILCMLLTSGVTVGGFAIWNHYNNNGGGNTYTLTSSKETLSYKSIIEMNENSVVSITTESVKRDAWAQNYVTTGAGSGIVISKDGYIMTCAHVVSDSSKITVTLANEKTFDAELVGINSSEDIAVLKIKASGLDPVTIGDSSELSVGDQVVAIGNPLGSLSGTATTGIISALERKVTIEGKTLTLLQTDASINPGNSGGALFNAKGELIGVVVAKSTGSDVEGLGFAIPVNQAKSVADDLIENGSPAGEESQSDTSGDSSISGGSDNSNGSDSEQTDHGTIGVMVTQLTEDGAEQAGFTSGAGLYIVQVTSQGAKAAGLQKGDKIVSCNGTSISSHDELQTVLQKTKSGDKATIGILRDGKSKTVTVVLS